VPDISSDVHTSVFRLMLGNSECRTPISFEKRLISLSVAPLDILHVDNIDSTILLLDIRIIYTITCRRKYSTLHT
jgi:hypothetical protein